MRYLQAVTDGNVSNVKSLLSTDSAILTSSDLGAKVVCLAAEKGFEEVLSCLLFHYRELGSPLNDLAAAGSEVGVSLLFQHGAIAESSSGLFKAIEKGYRGVVQAYINNGLDLHKTWRTPLRAQDILRRLVRRGQSELLRILLPQLSKSLERQDLQINLRTACSHSQLVSTGLIEILLHHCASMNLRLDLENLLLKSIALGQHASSKLLLMSDTVSKPTPALLNALKLALSIGDGETKSLILAKLDSNSSVDAVNDTARAIEKEDLVIDDSLFLLVVDFGPLETVKKLLDKGANAAARSRHGTAGLMKVSKRGHLALMKLLLDYGAEINEQNPNGKTALHYACDEPSERLEQVLELLLSKGANANSGAGQEVGTPLIYATRGERSSRQLISLVEILTRYGADVNASDSDGCTPIILMSRSRGHSAAVALLLKLGAEPNHQTKNGETALMSHCAWYATKLETMRVLLEGGASIHIKDKEGRTALSIYCSNPVSGFSGDAVNIMRFLLEHGDGIDPRSQMFTHALQQALQYIRGKLVECMYSYARSRDHTWVIPAELHDDLRKHIERYSSHWGTRTHHEFYRYLQTITEGHW